jgi:phosphate:Na+ symporter
VADFHTAFNLLLAALMLPLLAPYAALLARLLPAPSTAEDPSRPRYLDQAALESPPIALAAAGREALRMADALEAMLTGAGEALSGVDRRRIAEVRRLDDRLDRLNRAIKAYLTSLDPESLTEADSRRRQEILVFTTNLESAGDVIDHNVMGLVARRLKRGLTLPESERAETAQLLGRLGSTARAAAPVIMSEDPRAARVLVAEKEAFREIEAEATAAHFAAVQESPAAGEVSALRLDLLRELKRVNGHLVAAAAYPVLEGQGALLPTRLRLET